MFFATDVLFKDGPLALIWMAGNDEFKSQAIKNRRNKHYVLMLQANIGQLSDLIRKHFPQMGTAYGLSLKKTSVLVKGLSVIYLSQMQHLSWSMHDTHLKMQSSNIRMLREIDLPVEIPSRNRGGGEPRVDLALPAEPFVALGFGDLNESTFLIGDGGFGPRCFTTNADVSAYDDQQQGQQERQIIQTPAEVEGGNKNRRKKRKRHEEAGLDENGVLERMRDAVAQNQNAHTIRDADPIQPINPSREEGFGDFGGQGFDFMMPDLLDNQSLQLESRRGITTEGEFQGPEMISAEERLLLSPERRTTRDDLDNGQGRHAQRRTRRRMSENDIELEQQQQDGAPANNSQEGQRSQQGDDDLQLASLDSTTLGQQQQRGRKRRRHPLDIDAEPQIPMADIRNQLQQQKRPLDYDECQQEQKDSRDEAMEKKRMAKPTEFMFGKYNFRRIKEDSYKRKALSGFATFIAGAHDVALQQRSVDRQQTSDAAVTADEGGSVIRGAEEMIQFEEPPIVTSGSIINNNNEVSARPSDMDPPPMVHDMMENEYQQQPELDVPQISVEPSMPEDTGGGAVIDELEHGRFVFKKLFPVETTSKKKAATAFFQLLRMQSVNKVILEQRKPYGDIFVTKL